ncbi:1-acyl-sn-glycerol-3-phosphate acyltransferase [Paenibacillus sp. MSJ-34]|uniref:lysophospholipid acyltransferase family protein n=1 Tax=Paenibacillus sp. MSJ-34 TaxID=2841529 RepID=UPI001C109ADC|nr:lysophospholipid acyltransferase family protein [Paenibacillus sp. MSJ-34]MBU5443945.1 1-acyl-sn-glycerol-3-phosphate acyltransferase [Paenibacillus sp. MSJ-34]
MLYSFCRSLLRLFYRFVFRLQAVGVEHIPKEGPVLLCANHISVLDPPTLGVFLERRIHFMAKAELFKIPLFGQLIRGLGAFPVKRGGVSKESIRTALGILKEGKVMGIFPEGTRGGGMGKKGAASFALRSGAAVIPAAICGEYKWFRRMKIVYGPPVDLSEFQDNPSASLEQATDKIMKDINELIRTHR